MCHFFHTSFCLQQMTNREVEYVSLSRDTTESDLKQRREIKSGSAFYIDQVCLFRFKILKKCFNNAHVESHKWESAQLCVSFHT